MYSSFSLKTLVLDPCWLVLYSIRAHVLKMFQERENFGLKYSKAEFFSLLLEVHKNHAGCFGLVVTRSHGFDGCHNLEEQDFEASAK